GMWLTGCIGWGTYPHPGFCARNIVIFRVESQAMKNNLIASFENRIFKGQASKLPQFRPGDTVRVMYKVQEGAEKGKYRIQPFEGVVIRKKKGAVEGSFTVRKMGASSIGVERVFPLCSPMIDSV